MAKNTGTSRWIWGVFLVAPLVLGAKGCDAVVGNDPGPTACGGLTGAACARGQFCDFAPAAQCGAADATGLCRPIPDVCATIDEPVCGCDDMTHGNACSANMAGVSVVSDGECSSGGDGRACGGLLGVQCDADEFCKFAADALCGVADATGTCAPFPSACDTVFDPVCGCNDQTYGNACEANMAGVSVESDGPCGGGGGDKACGGLTGLPCEADEFCNFALDAICGTADATGICTPVPRSCTEEYVPVCGCDDVTYDNECSAHAAGTSVARDGACR